MNTIIIDRFTPGRLHIREIMLPLAPAILVTNDLFITYIQGMYPFFSPRRLAIAAIVLVFAWGFASIALHNISKLIQVIGQRGIRVIAILCALAGVAAVWGMHQAGRLPTSTLLHPIQEIQVTALEEMNPASRGSGIELLLFGTQFGFTSFSQLQTVGDWTRTERDSLRLESEARPAEIRWRGRSGEYIVLELQTGADAGKVAVAVNGERSEVFDLYEPTAGTETLYFKFPPLVIERVTSILSRYTSVFLALFAGGILLSLVFMALGRKYQRQIQALTSQLLKPAGAFTHKTGYWLLYSLPMVVVWGAGLLAFFPGLVSTDSLTHFRQAWQGGYDTWHSVLYTLLVAGLTVLVKSPAVVAGFQVLAFAIGIAWGLKMLDDLFCPAWVPWLLSVLMAVALPNILTVITIWKDVPYTLSMFLLTLMLLRTVQTEGAWLAAKRNWLWLALISTAVILFRQNGLLIPLASFGILFWLYARQWRQSLLSFALTMTVYLVFTGPVYQALGVEDTARYKVNQVILHHLAAHQAAGTPLNADERAFFDQILPPAEWEKYNCATVNNLYFNPAFDRDFMNQNGAHAAQLLGRLFIAEPMVDARHILCASAVVWNPGARTYLVESALDLNSGMWVSENSLGIHQGSRAPRLNASFQARMKAIDARENTWRYNLTWRPANYLYLALICWVVLARRRREFRFIFTLTTLLVHSFSVIMVNFAQDFRYQYPAFILGIYGLGFLLVRRHSHDQRGSERSE